MQSIGKGVADHALLIPVATITVRRELFPFRRLSQLPTQTLGFLTLLLPGTEEGMEKSQPNNARQARK